jgi:hypothetical protein
VVTDFFTAEPGIVAMAVDDQNIFFVSSPNVLGKLSIEGKQLVELVTGLTQLQRFTIDERDVYWTENATKIRSVPKSGGATLDVATFFGHPTAIAVSPDYVYAVMPDSGQIVMVSRPSGTPLLLSGQGTPQAIAVDETHVYWLNQGAPGTRSGQLVRALHGDLTSAAVLLSNLDAPATLTLTDDYVFWASPDAIMKVTKTGGSPEPVAVGFSDPKTIAVFDRHIYLAGSGGLSMTEVTSGTSLILDRRPMSSMALGCSGVYATAWFESALIRYGK